MRETRTSGSEGGGIETNRCSLPLSVTTGAGFETLSQSWWLLDAPLEAGHDTHSIQLFSAVSLVAL